MAQNITLLGASYSNVPAVQLPKTGGGTAIFYDDTGSLNISANGTHDVTGYASVNVAVPNSYDASDEGKVVDNGALVSQSSATYTTNDTYDTTLINEVTVNVSGGGVDMFNFTGGNIQAIIGTGTQYILTDFYNPFCIFGFKFQSSSSWASYEHYFSMSANNAVTGLQKNSNKSNMYWNYSSYKIGISNAAYENHEVVEMGFANPRTDQQIANHPLAIFAGYYNGSLESSRARFTFYGLNIIDFSDEYVARFMPWLENGVAGVKDLVSGTFYSNAGTGAFNYIDLQGVLHSGS